MIAQKCSSKVEYLDPSQELELWEKRLFGSDSCLVAAGGIGNKKKAVIKFNTWLKNRKLLDIIVYTDGSQEIDQSSEPTSTGAGWVLNWVDSWYWK